MRRWLASYLPLVLCVGGAGYASGCSLVFGSSGAAAADAGGSAADAGGSAADAGAEAADAGGSAVVTLPFTDDFNAAGVRVEWQQEFESGDSCEVTSAPVSEGSGALKCTTDATIATKAALSIAIPDVSSFRIEMDVRIEVPGGSFLSFAATGFGDGAVVQNISALDHTASDRFSLTHFPEKGGIDQGFLDVEFLPGTWHHVVIDTSIELGVMTTTLDTGGMQVELMSPAPRSVVNRVFVGVVFTLSQAAMTEVLIDDVVISEL